eukprot:gene26421-31926_t
MKAFKLSAAEMGKLLGHVNSLNVAKNYATTMKPFFIKEQILGYLNPSFADLIAKYNDVFSCHEDGLRLQPDVEKLDLQGRTSAIHRVNEILRQQGVIHGWRNEMFAVSADFDQPPAVLLERAAVPFYGTKAYGVHVNGYVRDERHEISHLWVGTRSPTKQTWPGMLDHIVAGGQPHGISLMDNVVKECEEEASIPSSLACKAVASGYISYNGLDEWDNLKRDVIFCYDLELPRDFTPTPLDGEVESFSLQPLDRIMDILLGRAEKEYKPNCNLVVIDFLMRHGAIDASSPLYEQLKAGLRS